ncbi:oxidized low density lipoprotein receptor 1, partial [Chelydra serpentina]
FSLLESLSPSPQWGLIAVILEILCLALLITVRVFDANSSQLSCLETREHDNLTQQRENLENLTQQLEFLQAQNLNLSEAVQQLASYQGSKCHLCPDKWLQHGEDCYHFSNEFKIWQESKDYCSSLASKLLQIDSKEELVNIPSFLILVDINQQGFKSQKIIINFIGMGFVPIFKVKKSLLEIVGNWDILSVRKEADLVPDWIKT